MTAIHLATLLDTALTYLNGAPDGNLPLGFREAIWSALGPRRSHAGRRRRSRLAAAAARRVAADLRRPETTALFERALRTGAALLDENMSPAAREAGDAIWTEAESSPDDDAATAAAKSVLTAAYDETWSERDIDLTRPENIDVSSGDTAYFAARARSGGHYLDRKTSTEARREFWRWWLTEAVPEAFASEPSEEIP
jgi:hypothetical protein